LNMTEITTKESPFSPGRPVPPEYFIARIKEIQRLERAIKQTVSGRNENIFITGPRGIGKSSLAGFALYLAGKHSLIGSHCILGGVRSLEEMMGVVFRRLLQDCMDQKLFDKLKDVFKKYIKGISLFGMGIEFTENKSELRSLVDDFLPAMRKIYTESQDSGKRGLILILDDLNGITDVPQFSQYIKSRVDELAFSTHKFPLLLLLVGLPERREDLVKHQPSVARIFDIIDLHPMTNSESEDFFTSMFNRQNITISSEALSLMVALSGGLPMLMHEVGDAVFWQDKDSHIDEQDALSGIEQAAQDVGRKYIEPQVSKLFKNKMYASILRKIHNKAPLGGTFDRQQILEALPSSERKNLDNFLQRSRKLGIIEAWQSHGEYKFVNPLHQLYAWHEAQNRKD
jgi:hypothetical protein